MKKFIPLALILFILACRSSAKDNDNASRDTIPRTENDSFLAQFQSEKKKIAAQMAQSEVTYFVIKTPDEKFGYSIFINGNLYIEQTTIPALEGNNGFEKKEDAEKVALFVIKKIKEGEMPPTITVGDLKNLNVIPR